MFQASSESKSDSDRLRQSSNEAVSPTATTTPRSAPSAGISNLATKVHSSHSHHQNQNHFSEETQTNASYLVSKQQTAATALHQHYLNYFNSNIPKEETKSQRSRSSFSATNHSHDHHPSQSSNHSIANQRTNHNTNRTPSNSNHPSSNQIQHVHQIPAQVHGHHPNSHQVGHNSNNMSRSVPRDESPMAHRFQQQQHQPQPQLQHTHMKPRTHSTGSLYPISQQMAFKTSAHNNRLEQQHPPLQQQQQQQQQQRDRDSEEATTTTATIKEELENDLRDCKTSELEAISSLERNLPIELSFLIRQQAHCMARMNYLDRQIRDLKEAAQSQQQVESNQVSSTSIHLNQNHMQRSASNIMNASTTMAHTKNGNFILSDDSGGEYSRATISDDDELSSLLDQIAKSVRPERGSGNSMISNNYSHLQQQQLQQQQLHQLQQQQQQQHRLAANCNTLVNNQPQPQPQQPYAIINPNQLHHQQAVPIFVMGSPIAVAHPSSINSNILPGVHFQPEPRYNQYYEDFYYGNNTVNSGLVASSMITTPTPAMHRHGHGNRQNVQHRSQQFENSISVIEQLVSQKEKRQIISQLKSADNWLRMRSCNQDSSLRATTNKQQQPSITKQRTAEAEIETLPGDEKQLAQTASTSTNRLGDDRVIADQIDE